MNDIVEIRSMDMDILDDALYDLEDSDLSYVM